MNDTLQALFAKLERETNALLNEIQARSSAQQTFKPSPEGWNALEVLAHLITVERGILGTHTQELGAITLKTRLAHWGMVQGLYLPIRLGVPVAGAKPADAPPLGVIGERWRTVRASLRERLEEAGSDRNAFARHPLCGPMTAAQTLAFFRSHVRHHRFQLERIRRSTGYPAR